MFAILKPSVCFLSNKVMLDKPSQYFFFPHHINIKIIHFIKTKILILFNHTSSCVTSLKGGEDNHPSPRATPPLKGGL